MKDETGTPLYLHTGMKKSSVAVLSALFSFSSLVAANVQAAMPTVEQLTEGVNVVKQAEESRVYLVRMKDNPVVAYEGGIKGFKATKPGKNKKIDPNSQAVLKYSDYLTSKHDAALKSVGASKKLYSYKYTYNGFAAELSPAQVAQLHGNPDVLTIVEDELLKPDTVSTASMLGLDATDGSGFWEALGGKENAGEGVVVGIIDSGIWPENESFSDRTGSNKNGKSGKLDYQQIPGWHGKCVPGEEFPASKCNQKLIAAQWFNSGFGGDANIKALFPYEYISARDADGHGSHTASTAAGNNDVEAIINGTSAGLATGMAPRARVAAYKVCWGTGGEGGCFGADSVAAIDQAVADGVDVINFSISGSRTSFLDQVEVAFLYAADAGVFVTASAGNSGPTVSTVAHNSPWLTTVAAGTHDRGWQASLTTVGDGNTYDGVSLAGGVGPAPMVYSLDVAGVGQDLTEARLCYPGTLDPAMVAGKIVLCDRGVIARTDKSQAVAMAGGVGMVLANTSPSSLNADFHAVPSIHVDHIAGNAIRAYVQANGADGGSISAGQKTVVEAPLVASFSSRGPALAGSGDLLKPDIMAPGVDIIAAVSPDGNAGENFGALSGTSMSSPHMAGLGALMKQAHPNWSPAAIKSAFMTSATQNTNMGNPIPGNAFGYGAGFVQPNKALDPGLVYDAGWNDWIAFLCATELNCGGSSIDPSDLNYPSIAVGSLAGSQTVTRTVTSVAATHATYTPEVDGLAGINVSFSPAVIEIAPGESKQYQVTFTNVSAPINQYVTGGITWVDGEQQVRSAVALKPVRLGAPAEVSGSGASGSLQFDLSFGYSGAYSAGTHGLVPAATVTGTVTDDPNNSYNAALNTCDFSSFPFACTGITWHAVSADAAAQLLRISLFNDYTDGTDDLDLYVYNSSFGFVGSSGGGSSAERVDIVNPSHTTYFVAVHGWQTDGADASYTLFSWDPAADASNMNITAPGAAAMGATSPVSINWSGLGAQKYLGVMSHNDGSGVFQRTVVSVEND
ncbi:S8 family peptidase [Aliiglaciecola sp. CAU 1673]|uniref:S8 family peptidase n=1 Tax=Aliiglaciecola sp. CAU 1673 TaxID=3032595 RepID=UPI0023DBB897|nr:S8 family peptidase [Aliiglaciecola sp. CAU 1673]MDF2179977.1 S8 family peptidase [Aliiglaciecola sp. CAU 1673]